MKTRAELYGREAAMLLRDITMYHVLTCLLYTSHMKEGLSMTKKPRGCSAAEDPRYHDTWCLLKKYRDVVWSLELSVQQLRKQFAAEYGSNIEDFLESIYPVSYTHLSRRACATSAAFSKTPGLCCATGTTAT